MKECTLTMRRSCKIWSACSLAYGGEEDLPPCIKESPSTDVQQLKAEILALRKDGVVADDMYWVGWNMAIERAAGVLKLLTV